MKDSTRFAPRPHRLANCPADRRQSAQLCLLVGVWRITILTVAVIFTIASASKAFADGAVAGRTSGVPLRTGRKKRHNHHLCCHCGRPAPLVDTCAGQWGDIIFPDSTIGEFPIGVGDFSSGVESGANAFAGASSGGSIGGGSAPGKAEALPPITNREFWASYNSTIGDSTMQTSNSWTTEIINQSPPNHPPNDSTCSKPPVNVGTVPDSGPGALFPVSLAGILWLHLKRRWKPVGC
jgi:hypothetical protein